MSTRFNKSYLQVPPRTGLSLPQKLRRALVGSLLSPAYVLLANRYSVPGLHLHWRSSLLGMRLLPCQHRWLAREQLFHLLFWPIDSTRYFEFDFVWRSLQSQPIERYLDVSSPRLLPLLLIKRNGRIKADLLNPDASDLAQTEALAQAMGIANRYQAHNKYLEELEPAAAGFDAISCISVLEHIAEDKKAIAKMWSMLNPGGKLVITVPCAAQAEQQFIDKNHFDLPRQEEKGFSFMQRFYDRSLIEAAIFSVTGAPRHQAIYGEKTAGFFRKNQWEKWANAGYPRWREPYTIGQAFRYYENVDSLPGEAVIALEFVKS